MRQTKSSGRCEGHNSRASGNGNKKGGIQVDRMVRWLPMSQSGLERALKS
jgi:hypothetical protein